MDHKPDRFIHKLCMEAAASAAVHHPYLQALAAGDFANMDRALQDFAFQYGTYSANFTHYLSAVVGNLNQSSHRHILLANLAEEQGMVDGAELSPTVAASVVGYSHSALFQRFQRAFGVDAKFVGATQPCAASTRWSQQFLTLCQMNECVGVGAIGIGTELIVADIYRQILQALTAHSTLTPQERVFFDLHSQCDDAHAAQMVQIATELAKDATARQQIEQGVQMAVDLRAAFWNEMLVRARSFPAADAAVGGQAAAVAH